MLEFIVGYVLGAGSAQESRPLTWRSMGKVFVALAAIFAVFWFLWQVLAAGDHNDACNVQAPLVRAWCDAADSLGSVLFFIATAAGVIVLLGYLVRALKEGE